MNFLKVKKLSPGAKLPSRGTEHSAGLDLYSPIDTTIQPGTRQLVNLDIEIELPLGTYGHILPRSGLALKKGIHVGAGVIDCDYRGNIGVLLFNLSDEPFKIKKSDRIAQMVVKKYEHLEIEEVKENTETQRGSGGFGSTDNILK